MYKYENIADKTKQGILNELETGLEKWLYHFLYVIWNST